MKAKPERSTCPDVDDVFSGSAVAKRLKPSPLAPSRSTKAPPRVKEENPGGDLCLPNYGITGLMSWGTTCNAQAVLQAMSACRIRAMPGSNLDFVLSVIAHHPSWGLLSLLPSSRDALALGKP